MPTVRSVMEIAAAHRLKKAISHKRSKVIRKNSKLIDKEPKPRARPASELTPKGEKMAQKLANNLSKVAEMLKNATNYRKLAKASDALDQVHFSMGTLLVNEQPSSASDDT